MKTIERIADMIDEELDDAMKYARCAIQNSDDTELNRLFKTLSTEELGHAMRLHDHVTRIIKQYRDEHGEPPEKMMDRYEYIHEKQMKKYADAKVLLA